MQSHSDRTSESAMHVSPRRRPVSDRDIDLAVSALTVDERIPSLYLVICRIISKRYIHIFDS